MTLPLGERFLRALMNRLRLITPSNGYHTSAGENAKRHCRTWADDELPAVSLFDGGTDVEKGDGSHLSMAMSKTLLIGCYAKADQEETGEVLSLLEADIKSNVLTWVTSGALRTDLNKQIGTLALTRTEPLAREEGSNVEGVALTFLVKYQEGYGDPNGPL